MLSIFHYWSAKERLAEHEKTIMMLGGESECQPMILAQKDMIELEMQYYKEMVQEFFWLTVKLLGVILFFAIGWKMYSDFKQYF